jgi:hypothetical protein
MLVVSGIIPSEEQFLVTDTKTGEITERGSDAVKSCFNVVPPEDKTSDDDLYDSFDIMEKYPFCNILLKDCNIMQLPIYDSNHNCIGNNALYIIAEYRNKGYLVQDSKLVVRAVNYDTMHTWLTKYAVCNYSPLVFKSRYKLYPVEEVPERQKIKNLEQHVNSCYKSLQMLSQDVVSELEKSLKFDKGRDLIKLFTRKEYKDLRDIMYSYDEELTKQLYLKDYTGEFIFDFIVNKIMYNGTEMPYEFEFGKI